MQPVRAKCLPEIAQSRVHGHDAFAMLCTHRYGMQLSAGGKFHALKLAGARTSVLGFCKPLEVITLLRLQLLQHLHQLLLSRPEAVLPNRLPHRVQPVLCRLRVSKTGVCEWTLCTARGGGCRSVRVPSNRPARLRLRQAHWEGSQPRPGGPAHLQPAPRAVSPPAGACCPTVASAAGHQDCLLPAAR